MSGKFMRALWPTCAESIEWFIERLSHCRMIWLLPPSPTPLSRHKLDRRHRGRLRKRDNLLTGEGGSGGSQFIWWWRRESLVLYKSFHTLCIYVIAFSTKYERLQKAPRGSVISQDQMVIKREVSTRTNVLKRSQNPNNISKTGLSIS